MSTPRCMPAGVAGPCANPLMLDDRGHSKHPDIADRVTSSLHRGDLHQVNGIIVHQTMSSTAAHTLAQYSAGNSNGAHFLIGKDGSIYQTASVYKITYHVGKLRSLCVARNSCTPVNPRKTSAQEVAYVRGLNATDRHRYESVKPVTDRYPLNSDSIGIEIVGNIIGDDPKNPGEKLYEPVNVAQNKSLKWLVEQLSQQFGVSFNAVYRHPTVSQKTPSEASTANWGFGTGF